MMKRAVRLALLTVFIAAMGVTACLFWMAERESQLAETAARHFDDGARAAAVEVADLRAAQQAYVAAGQGEGFWFARTQTLLADLKSRIASLKGEASSSGAGASLDEALGVIQDFEQMDGRARELGRTRQSIPASDLIFSDGVDLSRRIAGALEQARTAELSARDAAESALRRREVFSLGAAAAASTLIVLLLVPAGATPDEAVRATPVAPVRRDDSLGDVVPGAASRGPRPQIKTPDAPPAIDLSGVAALCSDLARVVDTRALPALLARAATLLDANGIVLWIADPDGRELAPIMAHGYPANLVTRLGSIPRDAENVTASAFRTRLLQTVQADAVSPGAIAAPIVAAGGCVGVMAAEMRHGGERQEPKLAAASIIAAQLATLVGPPSVRAAAPKSEATGA